MKKTNKDYAFWKYDRFPFVLGGEVTGFRGDGWVETENYGWGCYFKPIKIVPLEDGLAMQEELDKQQSDYERLMESVKELSLTKLKSTYPFVFKK